MPVGLDPFAMGTLGDVIEAALPPPETSVTLLRAETIIVEEMLDWLDWRGHGDPPCPVTIGSRKEGHPRTFLGTDVTYPLVCVKLTNRTLGNPVGHQQQITFQAKVYYVMEMEENTYVDEVIRENVGAIAENLLQSNRLGLSWVSDFVLLGTEFEDSDLERMFRRSAMRYMSGEATFRILAFYDR